MSKRMYIIIALLLILSGFVTFKNLRAQVHVDSASYDIMLSTLLSHSVNEISVDEAAVDSTAVFIDTRELAEYNVSHIEHAIWVGYDDFDANRLKDVEKNARLIIYCSVGYRSEKITEKLIQLGFTNISNLYGGIFEWVNNCYPVVDTNGNQTSKVHAYSSKWGIWLNKGEKVYE